MAFCLVPASSDGCSPIGEEAALTKLFPYVIPQEIKMEGLFGRKVAVDASMSIYQFLIAMQRPDGTVMLTNAEGETTSHLQGLMNRTIKMAECGIKPVYVFDGKPPERAFLPLLPLPAPSPSHPFPTSRSNITFLPLALPPCG